MKDYVVDASVAAKWFLPEVHWQAAAGLLSDDVILSAPDLIVPEFGNLLRKKQRRGELTSREAADILDAFLRMPIEIHAATPLIPAAMQLANALDRTVYDMLYLTLAAAQESALITADRKLYRAVVASGLAASIRWIEDTL